MSSRHDMASLISKHGLKIIETFNLASLGLNGYRVSVPSADDEQKVLDQLKNLLGLPAVGTGHDHFLARFWLTLAQLGKLHAPTLLLGLGTMVIVLALRLLSTRLRVPLPSFLIAIVTMAAVVVVFDLEDGGVSVIGAIPSSLPALEAPHFSWSEARGLASSALAIAILGLLEAIAMAKAIASRTRQKLDINQQCLSEGVANLAGSFFQCFPGSGSLTRSSINQQAGARTQWSGVISAAAVAGILGYAAVGHVREPAAVQPGHPRGPHGLAPAGPDRHPVVHLGARVRGVRLRRSVPAARRSP